jgi:hypothetical protein
VLLSWLRSRLLAETEYPVGGASEKVPVDLSRFNPTWKQEDSQWLSPLGRHAILAAYDQRMRQRDVCILFRVSPRAAHHWHRRWKLSHQKDAGALSIAALGMGQERVPDLVTPP